MPGSFELPVLAAAMAKSGKYDAVITVGAVVSVPLPCKAVQSQARVREFYMFFSAWYTSSLMAVTCAW